MYFFYICAKINNADMPMNKPEITKDIYLDELIENYIFAIKYLCRKGGEVYCMRRVCLGDA